MAKRTSKGKVSIPHYRWMMFWLLVLTSVALVCAIFGNVNVKTLKKPVSSVPTSELVQENERLEAEVARLEALNLNEAENKKTGDPAIGNDNCPYIETGAPENYIKYTDRETRVTMTLPYSLSWGGVNCWLMPLESPEEGSIEFGPKIALGEYTVRRDARLTILPIIEDIEVELAKLEETFSDVQISNRRTRTVNGLTVISFTLSRALGGQDNYWWALGRSYSYELHSYQWLTDAEAIKIIQSLRVTK